jgi:hypothetical protein
MDQYRRLIVLGVLPSNQQCEHNDIIIVSSDTRPSGEAHFWSNCNGKRVKFECRVLIGVRGSTVLKSPLNFDGVRFVRHGNGFNNWWRQDRGDSLMVQVEKFNRDVNGVCLSDPMPHLNSDMFLCQSTLHAESLLLMTIGVTCCGALEVRLNFIARATQKMNNDLLLLHQYPRMIDSLVTGTDAVNPRSIYVPIHVVDTRFAMAVLDHSWQCQKEW